MSAVAFPTPRELEAYLDAFVQGQAEAKRDLARAVYLHYLAVGHRIVDPDDPIGDFGRGHVLLIGPTGSGKTYLVRKVAERLGVPYCFLSATSLVQTGYAGTSIESALGMVLDRADHDLARARRSIVFLDEIDKVRRHPTESNGPDVNGEGVQNALLTVLDGQTLTLSSNGRRVAFDTSELLFVAAGAFVGLGEIVSRRRGRAGAIGFVREREEPVGGSARGGPSPSAPSGAPGPPTVETEDLVEFGLIPEFIGRFGTIAQLRPLSAHDLIAILDATRGSILAKQRKLFSLHGITLEFTEGALLAVAEQAERLGTGARGLERTVRRALSGIDSRLHDLAARGVSRVVVTAETVRHGAEPEIEPSRLFGGPIEADRLRRKVALELKLSAAATQKRAGRVPLSPREELERIKPRIGWPRLLPSARAWWNEHETRLGEEARLGELVALARTLEGRRATIDEFVEALEAGGTRSWRAAIYYMEYLRLSQNERSSPRPATGRQGS